LYMLGFVLDFIKLYLFVKLMKPMLNFLLRCFIVKERWSATTGISLMYMCFILKNMGKAERHNNGVYVKGSISIEFKVDYHEKLKEVIEL